MNKRRTTLITRPIRLQRISDRKAMAPLWGVVPLDELRQRFPFVITNRRGRK